MRFPTSCICYAIDRRYLFPTLLSALQARRAVATDCAALFIVCVANDRENLDIITDIAAENDITLIWIGKEQIDNLHPMYGRLFLAEILPRQYDRIVYLDGDTQIRGDLTPLVTAAIPPGRFLAVRDPAILFARVSKRIRAQFDADRKEAGLDQRPEDDYFNTGVMIGDRATWTELSRATLDIVRSRKSAFKFGDQDPLNLAFGERCLYISNRWNFPGFLIGTALERRIDPVIYHFMSNPRPWVFRGLPWGSQWARPYDDLLRRYPALAPLAPKASCGRRLRYHVKQIVKCATQYRSVSRLTEKIPDLPL